MPTFRSLAEFGHELERLGKDLEAAEKRKITKEMGDRAQQLATRAAQNDLGGDDAFSGWRRNKPLNLVTEVRSLSDGAAMLKPTKQSAGPWTVAEDGRNQGNATGFFGPGANRTTGVTARTKSGGVRKVRAWKAKRWNGTTKPKNTASDAVELMDRELPKIAERGVRRAIRKRFD